MHFNPADVQTIGIGLAAFLTTLAAIFLFLSASGERLARMMTIVIAAAAIFSWFGFLYEIVPDLALARAMRVLSVMGIVWLSMAHVNWSLMYLRERKNIGRWDTCMRFFGIVIGSLLTLLLVGDLFGGRLIVGDLLESQTNVLAPNAGPLLAVVIAYYALCILITAVGLSLRVRTALDKSERRQAEIIFFSLVIGLVLGGTRFTPWYGFVFQPLVAGFAAPLFLIAMFYSIKRYNLFNLQILVAQLLVFALWAFTFFRALLNSSLTEAIPDIGLFVAVLILGVFLLRSVINGIRTQKELARLTVDRVKSEFVTIAAHQLRTPLTAVRWAFDLLLSKKGEGGALSPEQQKTAGLGSGAADNMMLIVNDLLSVARISGGVLKLDFERGDVRDAILAGADLFGQAAKNKNIHLSFDLPHEPIIAVFDRDKLALAIENLIDNAIKYTRDGGSVLIRSAREGSRIIISIIDSGIGISREDEPRLFEKFFRGKSATRMVTDGSGLGLFITKNIVDGHGGSVSLAPAAGGGTSATIELPTNEV